MNNFTLQSILPAPRALNMHLGNSDKHCWWYHRETAEVLCTVSLHVNVPVGLHVDDLDAQHGAVEHEVAGLIKDDICQSDPVHLLQFSLHSHPPPELHVGQLLPHLLQLCEHLTYKTAVMRMWISPMINTTPGWRMWELTVNDSSNTLISFPVRKRKILTFLSEAMVAIFLPSEEKVRLVG